MSSERKAGLTESDLSEEAVASYLSRHPEFFDAHPELTARLRIPHHSGPAVSLVEKQVGILRNQNQQLERKLADLIDAARNNEALLDRIHHLAVALLEAKDLSETLAAIQESLRERFASDELAVCLFVDRPEVPESGPVRRIDRDDPAVEEAFAGFLKTAKPQCGRLRESQMEFLFGERADRVGSAALVPIGSESRLGLLAIGNRQTDHFIPSQGTVFLARIGDLVASALQARLSDSAPSEDSPSK